MRKNIPLILHEINSVLSKINEEQVYKLVLEILRARTIIGVGAGRVGMAMRGFIMRLGHLGLRAYTLGDTTLPSLGASDLVLVASGSGETQTIYDILMKAVESKARISVITGNTQSRMAKAANVVVEFQVPSKVKAVEGFTSQQPMTTLNEQCLMIFFDALVLQLMKHLNETHESMWARHSTLE